MRKMSAVLSGLMVSMLTWPVYGQAPSETPVKEMTFDLFMFGQPLGRMNVEELKIVDVNQTYDAARVTMDMTMNRMGSTVGMAMTHMEYYNADGNLARFRTDLKMSSVTQTTEGEVRDGEVHVIQRDPLTGQTSETAVAWDPEVISEHQMERDYAELIHKPVGSQLTHKVFVADLLRTVRAAATYEGIEERETAYGAKNLHKIRLAMQLGGALPGVGAAVSETAPTTPTLPLAGGVSLDSMSWVDGEGELYEQEISLAMFKLRAVRVRSGAPKPPSPPMAPDVFTDTILRTNRRIPHSSSVRRAVYQLKFNEGQKPSFYVNDDQRVLSVEGGALRMERTAPEYDKAFLMNRVEAPRGGPDYLAATPFAQSDDPEIRRIAHEVAGEEDDAWKRALKLEQWVHDHVREKSMDVGFASARETLERSEGDCTEHATLLVALLRAAGLPARAADGLVYAESIGGFGYHMWAEVYLDGWRALDATRPGPFVDATHLQMGESALDANAVGDMSFTLLKYIGQFKIEVEETE